MGAPSRCVFIVKSHARLSFHLTHSLFMCQCQYGLSNEIRLVIHLFEDGYHILAGVKTIRLGGGLLTSRTFSCTSPFAFLVCFHYLCL